MRQDIINNNNEQVYWRIYAINKGRHVRWKRMTSYVEIFERGLQINIGNQELGNSNVVNGSNGTSAAKVATKHYLTTPA